MIPKFSKEILIEKISKSTPRKIITNRGVLFEDEVRLGDTFFEYNTNEPVTVVEIKEAPIDRYYLVFYSDGRYEIMDMYHPFTNGSFFVGENLINIDTKYLTPFNPCKFNIYDIGHGILKDINQRPYYPYFINPYGIDFYTMGAIYVHGDLSVEYVNLPDRFTNVIDHIKDKYHLESHSVLGQETVYFQLQSRDPSSKLTWEEFMMLQGSHMNMDDYIMRLAYANINNRLQFIRAAFDGGYSKKESPDNNVIVHNDLKVLKNVQWIMWSIGILSKITARKVETGSIQYNLFPLGDYATYPGLFYDINNIQNMIDEDNRVIHPIDHPFELKIKHIEPVIDLSSARREWRGKTYYFRLSKPCAYISGQFLPMPSLQ